MIHKSFLCFFTLLISILLLCLCSGCAKTAEALPMPENFQVEKRVLRWDAVENASGYVIRIGNEEFEVQENSFPLYSITANGGNFSIDVMAVGDKKHFVDSSWNRIEESFEAIPEEGYDDEQYQFILMEDKSGYELSRGFADLEGIITLPAFFNDYPVKRIAEYAFSSTSLERNCFSGNLCNHSTTGILLPDTLESIGTNAFACMLRLEEIVIPDSVKTIEYSAFDGCTNLKRVTLPKGLKKIARYCFSDTAISDIVLPESLEIIEEGAFYCIYYTWPSGKIDHISSDLSTINLPASLKRIEDKAFGCRESLKTILWESKNLEWFGEKVFSGTMWYDEHPDGFLILGDWLYCYKGEVSTGVIELPKEVKKLASEAFSGITTLKAIHIPDGILLGGKDIFEYCNNLEEIILPGDLKCIPNQAFLRCTSLRQLIIPETVSVIEAGAFQFAGLECVTIPSHVKTISQKAFSHCENLKSVYISDGVEIIEQHAFSNCINLSEIRLPNTLKELHGGAFYRCAVENVIIPSSVEVFKGQVFNECKNLSQVFYEGSMAKMTEILSNPAFEKNPLFTVGAVIYCYSEEKPNEEGNFWRYIDGAPAIW